ncbi:hypothetical protein FRC08_010135 [Ceratobasidium sp. 394]|nr:hypothetical protein FRC08_010135 [Ceratobasidium sp. 394]
MALGAGTYEHSCGTVTGASTLARSCNLLQRTGLNTNMNKVRPDFHKCDEALLHDLEARMRECFFAESGCTNEEEMIAWVNAHTDTEVFDLATRVYANHASSAALEKLKRIDSIGRLPAPRIVLNRAARLGTDSDRIGKLRSRVMVLSTHSRNASSPPSSSSASFLPFLPFLTGAGATSTPVFSASGPAGVLELDALAFTAFNLAAVLAFGLKPLASGLDKMRTMQKVKHEV